jgi:D-glycero-D-manno-heptose 1,7-bisphosphate phosphatase
MGLDPNRRALFLDRDGTVIYDAGYPNDASAVTLIPGVVEALSELRALDFALVLVSNQSGVGRGRISPEAFRSVHSRFEALLREGSITLDGVYYCTHAPSDGCTCRKPSAAMILDAAAMLQIDLGASFMVGDKETDVAAGRTAGCSTILLGNQRQASHQTADCVAQNWRQVVQFIKERLVPS